MHTTNLRKVGGSVMLAECTIRMKISWASKSAAC